MQFRIVRTAYDKPWFDEKYKQWKTYFYKITSPTTAHTPCFETYDKAKAYLKEQFGVTRQKLGPIQTDGSFDCWYEAEENEFMRLLKVV